MSEVPKIKVDPTLKPGEWKLIQEKLESKINSWMAKAENFDWERQELSEKLKQRDEIIKEFIGSAQQVIKAYYNDNALDVVELQESVAKAQQILKESK